MRSFVSTVPAKHLSAPLSRPRAFSGVSAPSFTPSVATSEASLVLQRKVYKTGSGYQSHALPGQDFETREEALDAERAALHPETADEHIEHSDRSKRDHQRKRERAAAHKRKSRQASRKVDPEPDLDARKKKALGIPDIDPSLKGTYEKYQNAGVRGDFDTPGRALTLSDEQTRNGPFDEHHAQPKLVWRTDTRSPQRVFHPKLGRKEKRAGLKQKDIEPGFQTSAERERITEKGKGKIVYRTGHDDITSASGISVSPDIRSASFFPFGSKASQKGAHQQHTYLYGIAANHTVNTYKAQKKAEHVETRKKGKKAKQWKDPARFHYDPSEANAENTSTVWPYKEEAMHRVLPHQIVAAYHVDQDRIDAGNSKAGSGFSLKPARLPKAAERTAKSHPLREQADATASLYRQRYPTQPRSFLSYQGKQTFHRLPDASKADEPSVIAHDPFPAVRNPPSSRKLARRKKAQNQKNKERRSNNGNSGGGSYRGR